MNNLEPSIYLFFFTW